MHCSRFGVSFILYLVLLAMSASACSGEVSTGKARLVLEPAQRTVLASQIASKVISVSVKVGEPFIKSTSLIALDCALQQAEHLQIKTELEKARIQQKVQAELEMLKSGSILDSQIANANVTLAEAKLSASQITLDYCQIQAPFAGKVVKKLVNAHQYVSVGQPMLEIIDNTYLVTKVIVPSKWLAMLKVGAKFQVVLDENEQRYAASVERIGAVIDPASQSIEVYGRLEGNHSGLVPGMSGFAIFSQDVL